MNLEVILFVAAVVVGIATLLGIGYLLFKNGIDLDSIQSGTAQEDRRE